MHIEAFQAQDKVARPNFVRSLVSDQLRVILEHRSTRFAVVGFLMVLASLSTLIPTPEGVTLAWMFIVPVAISAVAGGLKEGATVAITSALISALYATAEIGSIDLALVGSVLLGNTVLYGIVAAVLGAFAEAHQSVQSHLRTLASLDPLTKVSNVARFYEEIGIMEAQKEGFAVLLVDVDDLKVLNDRYGHQTGSHAIRTVADALRKVVRTSDCVARFGGDEFVMILKDADRAGAQVVVNRLRSVLGEQTLPGAPEAEVTVSVGVAMFGEDGTNSEELLARADEAMYEDKRERKSRALVK